VQELCIFNSAFYWQELPAGIVFTHGLIFGFFAHTVHSSLPNFTLILPI